MDDKLPDGKKPSNVGTVYGPGAAGREPARVGDAPEGRVDSPEYASWRQAFTEANEIAKRYVPSERGELAARLVDDEAARLPWTPPSYDLTDDDFDRVRALLDMLLDAVETGDREVLDRLPAAREVLHPRPKTDRDRLVDYVKWIEAMHARLPHTHLPLNSRGLAEWVDKAFASVTPERLREAIESIADDPLRRGGAGQAGAAHVAAELAVEVNAFESSSGNYDEDVAHMMGRIQQARSKTKAKDKA